MSTPALPVPDAEAGDLLLAHYGTAQRTVAARAALAVYNLWMQIIDPFHFSDSWEKLNPLVNGIISTHYDMTAAQAAQYYANSRVLAGGTHMHVPGASPDMQYIDKVANIMGPGQFFHFLKEQDETASASMANDALRGATTRMVMMGGRDTVTGAAAIDPVAKGWERVIEPGACGFCAMLAGRGAVYKATTADFRAHDHCHCVARAVFLGQQSVNEDLSAQWGKVTKGYSGKAARAAWNAHWESRHVEPEHGPAKVPPEAGAGHAPVERERVR